MKSRTFNFSMGTSITDAITSKEAIKLAKLDYEVGIGEVSVKYTDPIIPLLTESDNHAIPAQNSIVVPNAYATYNKNTGHPFGVVGARYNVIQNIKLFSFIDDIIGVGEACFETAGSFNNGKSVYMSIKLPSHIIVEKDGIKDDINNYLLITSSHDGSQSIRIAFTPVRIFCSNLLSAAFKAADAVIHVRHTISADSNLELAKQSLGIVDLCQREISNAFNAFTNVKISDDGIIKYIAELFLSQEERVILEQRRLTVMDIASIPEISTRKKNLMGDIQNFYYSGIGQDVSTTKGTLFGAYNAITGYFSNVKNYKDDSKKMGSLFLGADNKMIGNAMSKSLEILNSPLLQGEYN